MFTIDNKGKERPVNAQEDEKELYKTIDNFLQLLTQKSAGYFNITNKKHRDQAIAIMNKYHLISYRNPAEKYHSIIDITLDGRAVLKKGGIEIYLNELEQKSARQDQIEELSLRKLKLEQVPAKWWWAIAISQLLIAAAAAYVVEILTK